MTTYAINAGSQTPSAPVARPVPVDRDEYAAETCPVCFGGLWQRVRGLFCPRCRGWLVEEMREGRVVHSLWQGRP